jgi:hypothetical protein
MQIFPVSKLPQCDLQVEITTLQPAINEFANHVSVKNVKSVKISQLPL